MENGNLPFWGQYNRISITDCRANSRNPSLARMFDNLISRIGFNNANLLFYSRLKSQVVSFLKRYGFDNDPIGTFGGVRHETPKEKWRKMFAPLEPNSERFLDEATPTRSPPARISPSSRRVCRERDVICPWSPPLPGESVAAVTIELLAKWYIVVGDARDGYRAATASAA